jgi:paraquat-inducible protein B
MSKQANPTVVGGFVVGAAALVVSGVLAFGPGDFLQDEYEMVAYFQSSVTGLDVGAPVRFQGVEVGRVTSIRAVLTPAEDDILIPVTMCFASGALHSADADSVSMRDPEQLARSLIASGLRAELQTDSIVTGKLYVGLHFHPQAEARIVGDGELLELPTVETGLSRLKKSLEELPVEEVFTKIIRALDSLEGFVSSGRIEDLVANIEGIVTDVGRLVNNIDDRVGPLSDSALLTMEDLRATIETLDNELLSVSEDLQNLLEGAGAKLGPLSASAEDALTETRNAAAGIDRLLGEDPTLIYRLAGLLEELTDAARAIRTLAGYLERHPEALLSGKGE